MSDRIHSLDDFLVLLKGVKGGSDGQFEAMCPAHDHPSHRRSLSIKETDGKILLKCFSGCEVIEILAALKLEPRDLFLNGDGVRGDSNTGRPRYSVTPTQKRSQKTVTSPEMQGVTGVTLAQLAEAKHLPVDFLKSLGLSDSQQSGLPVVRIPYLSEDGQEVAVRFRQALKGSRFRWRKGDHVLPYGLNWLGEIRAAGWVVIVEGESDSWTCRHHGIPVLGAPGKATWKAAWGEYVKGLQVFVWQEPDAQDFVLRVLATAPDCRFIVAPEGVKDISEGHIQGLDIPEWLEALKARAEYGQALKARAASEQRAEAYEAARHIIESEDPLELVATAIRGLGYGGDLKPAKIVYLAATSRVLEMRQGAMPVHVLLMGPPSAGKNYTLSRVVKLLPPEAVHTIDAGSPRVLIYDEAELQHRVLIFSEADSLPAGEDNPAASAIRNLLQDHHLHYVVTVRDQTTGDYTIREVDKPGPTTLITTSTQSLGGQLMTRLFTLQIADTKDQIGAALKTQAALETDGITEPDAGLIAFQAYLQLSAPIKVAVPFARELGDAMAKVAAAPRILRDFARLVSLIKSTALIRQHHRQIDGRGSIVAGLADYESVRELVNDMYVDTSTGATSELRKLVEAVTYLSANRVAGAKISVTKIATHLGVTKMAASRRARRAMREDWLINRETRKGYPADYEPGEAMPETEGLPTLQDLASNTITPNAEGMLQDSSFGNEDRNTVTAITDDGIPPHTGPQFPESAVCHVCAGTVFYLRTDGVTYYCHNCDTDYEGAER
jgi:hypothetical protein